MSQHTLVIPEDIYQELIDTAKAEGMSPVNWIASRLSVSTRLDNLATDIPEDLIGSVDSSEVSAYKNEETDFGRILKAKYEKQGLRFP